MSRPVPNVTVAIGVLRNAKGEILLGRRSASRPYAGCWEMPGGKVDVEESPALALAREWYEEFGVQIFVGPFLYMGSVEADHEGKPYDVVVHEVQPREGGAQDLFCAAQLRCHNALDWFSPERVLALVRTKDHVPSLFQVIDHCWNELAKRAVSKHFPGPPPGGWFGEDK